MQTEPIKCSFCKQVFDSFEALRAHEKLMTETKKYKNHQGFDAY
jgi:hypothetical protein